MKELGSKYADCIMYSENMEFPKNRPIPWIANFNDRKDVGNFYSIHWNMPKSEEEVQADAASVGHPPHMHKENELMFLIGMDPYNPYDLGAEVELCIGETMEKHIITRTCCVKIPANTPHGFYRITKCTRPWMFMQVQEANPRTEKFLWEYLTLEEIAAIPERLKPLWVDTGYDN